MAYETQNTIGNWLVEAINPPVEKQIIKLRQEVEEFAEAMESGNSSHAAEELADVALVVFGIAFLMGFSILKAMNKKMVVNRLRSWKLVNGVGQHVD